MDVQQGMDNQSSVDEFFVDDFLDLSNGFGEDEIEKLEEQPNGIHSQKTCSSSPQKLLEKMEAAENEDFGSFPGSELNFQVKIVSVMLFYFNFKKYFEGFV